MTAREKRIAELDEQRRCLEQLTEYDIGCDVWVRDCLDDAWEGPFTFRGFSSSDHYPVEVNDGAQFYRHATKTPPIEPQKITLRRWDGRKCTLSDDAVVLFRYRDGTRVVSSVEVIPSDHWSWNNTDSKDDITHYAPIEIEVED